MPVGSHRRRVVVTGAGAVSAAGSGARLFWRACVDGQSKLRPIARFDARPYGSPLAGQAADPGTDASARGFVLEAAREATAGAGLHAGDSWCRSAGVVIGTCLGEAEPAFDTFRGAAADPEARFPLLAWHDALPAPARALADAYELAGPVLTTSSACCSGTSAIGLATSHIRRGAVDVVLAGGVDVLCPFILSGFRLLGALTSDVVRPFDRRRDGLALGEGAGILVLEERDRALRRGAHAIAEIAGFGCAADAHHMTGPSPEGDGVVRAITAALSDAGLHASSVDFVNAHGTGTSYNDRMETVALKRVFGERAFRVPVNSVKPIVGHALGAAGALEAIVAIGALREGIVPPTIHYEEPDPECDLDYVPRVAREHPTRCALSCSSAFGGSNAVLVMMKP